MEDSMKPLARSFAMVTGLVLLVTTVPSWGGPPNPTASDAHQNTAGGTGALRNVVFGPAGGFGNTAFGFDALLSNDTGFDNTAFGSAALSNNVDGFDNTALGLGALSNNVDGFDNTAVGMWTLLNNTSGIFNTACGSTAL